MKQDREKFRKKRMSMIMHAKQATSLTSVLEKSRREKEETEKSEGKLSAKNGETFETSEDFKKMQEKRNWLFERMTQKLIERHDSMRRCQPVIKSRQGGDLRGTDPAKSIQSPKQ